MESESAKRGFSIGLENIQKRYSFFTREPVVIRDQEKFSVQLPLLSKKLMA
jgi:hypothetical protein